MNILHVLPHWTYGGVEIFVSTLSQYSEHDHFFVAFNTSNIPPAVPKSLYVYYGPDSPAIDVYHYHHAGVRYDDKPEKSIFTVHNVYAREIEKEIGRHERVVAVSSGAEMTARDQGLISDCVIPPPIDLSLFSPDTDAHFDCLVKRVKSTYGFDTSDRPIVLWAGRICPGKRPEVLARLINDYRDEFQFCVVGSDYIAGSNFGIPNSVYNAFHSVTWISHADHKDMPLLYHMADVVLSTSKREGFGLTIAEAMACGTPVVVPDVIDLAGLVDSGNAGYIYEGGSDEIADKIRQAVEWEEGEFRLGLLGVDRIRKLGCDAEEVAAKYDRIYEEIG